MSILNYYTDILPNETITKGDVIVSDIIMQIYIIIVKYKLIAISFVTLYFLLLFFGDIFIKKSRINRIAKNILSVLSFAMLTTLLIGNLIVFNSAKEDGRFLALNNTRELGKFSEIKMTNKGWAKSSEDLMITKNGVIPISQHGKLLLKAGEVINDENLEIETYWGPLTLSGKTYMEVKLKNNKYLKLTMYNDEITYSVDNESFDLKG